MATKPKKSKKPEPKRKKVESESSSSDVSIDKSREIAIAISTPRTTRASARVCQAKMRDDSIMEQVLQAQDGQSKPREIDFDFNKLRTDPSYIQPDLYRKMEPENFTMEYYNRTGLNEVLIFNCDPQKLGMKMVNDDFTVRDVETLVGGNKMISVVDVATQGSVEMPLKKFIEYYYTPKDKKAILYNVLSLEFSNTALTDYVRSPQLVRSIDWASCWPDERKTRTIEFNKDGYFNVSTHYPRVEHYCLMSPTECYTDFHIDFHGTSVWYHVKKGMKIFWIVEPTEQNLMLYEEYLKNTQSSAFFGDIVEKCARVEVRPGNTLIIPSGWIHSVFTPEDSLVFGGNFLHSRQCLMQLSVLQGENRIGINKRYRYPYSEETVFFQMNNIVEDVTGRSYIRPVSRNQQNVYREYCGKLFEEKNMHRRVPVAKDYADDGQAWDTHWEETAAYISCKKKLLEWDGGEEEEEEEEEEDIKNEVKEESETSSIPTLSPQKRIGEMCDPNFEEEMNDEEENEVKTEEDNQSPMFGGHDDWFPDSTTFYHPISFNLDAGTGATAIHTFPLSNNEPALNINHDRLKSRVTAEMVPQLEGLVMHFLRRPRIDLPYGLTRPNSLLHTFCILLRERRRLAVVEGTSLIPCILPDKEGSLKLHNEQLRAEADRKRRREEAKAKKAAAGEAEPDSDYDPTEGRPKKKPRKSMDDGGIMVSRVKEEVKNSEERAKESKNRWQAGFYMWYSHQFEYREKHKHLGKDAREFIRKNYYTPLSREEKAIWIAKGDAKWKSSPTKGCTSPVKTPFSPSSIDMDDDNWASPSIAASHCYSTLPSTSRDSSVDTTQTINVNKTPSNTPSTSSSGISPLSNDKARALPSPLRSPIGIVPAPKHIMAQATVSHLAQTQQTEVMKRQQWAAEAARNRNIIHPPTMRGGVQLAAASESDVFLAMRQKFESEGRLNIPPLPPISTNDRSISNNASFFTKDSLLHPHPHHLNATSIPTSNLISVKPPDPSLLNAQPIVLPSKVSSSTAKKMDNDVIGVKSTEKEKKEIEDGNKNGHTMPDFREARAQPKPPEDESRIILPHIQSQVTLNGKGGETDMKAMKEEEKTRRKIESNCDVESSIVMRNEKKEKNSPMSHTPVKEMKKEEDDCDEEGDGLCWNDEWSETRGSKRNQREEYWEGLKKAQDDVTLKKYTDKTEDWTPFDAYLRKNYAKWCAAMNEKASNMVALKIKREYWPKESQRRWERDADRFRAEGRRRVYWRSDTVVEQEDRVVEDKGLKVLPLGGEDKNILERPQNESESSGGNLVIKNEDEYFEEGDRMKYEEMIDVEGMEDDPSYTEAGETEKMEGKDEVTSGVEEPTKKKGKGGRPPKKEPMSEKKKKPTRGDNEDFMQSVSTPRGKGKKTKPDPNKPLIVDGVPVNPLAEPAVANAYGYDPAKDIVPLGQGQLKSAYRRSKAQLDTPQIDVKKYKLEVKHDHLLDDDDHDDTHRDDPPIDGGESQQRTMGHGGSEIEGMMSGDDSTRVPSPSPGASDQSHSTPFNHPRTTSFMRRPSQPQQAPPLIPHAPSPLAGRRTSSSVNDGWGKMSGGRRRSDGGDRRDKSSGGRSPPRKMSHYSSGDVTPITPTTPSTPSAPVSSASSTTSSAAVIAAKQTRVSQVEQFTMAAPKLIETPRLATPVNVPTMSSSESSLISNSMSGDEPLAADVFCAQMDRITTELERANSVLGSNPNNGN